MKCASRGLAWLAVTCGVISMLTTSLAAAEKTKLDKANHAYPPEFPDAKAEVYKQLGDTALKLYIFSPPGELKGQNRPAIVFFFGGGWSSGTPNQFVEQCRYLASRGMVAVTADYRVSTRNQTKVVDCVRDAKSAIRWVREHAAELGVDPDRIVAAGGSAGGHLAACTGTIEGFEHEGETTAISSKPDAMVLFNPVGSLVLMEGDTTEPAQQRKLDELSSRFGTEARNISPAENVRAGAPPTLVMFGTDDNLLAGGRKFADAMTKAGNRCELDLYEGQRHGFFNLGRSPDNALFRRTLESTDRFLVSLGYLQGEPKVDAFFD